MKSRKTNRQIVTPADRGSGLASGRPVEGALQASEQRFRDLLANSPDAIFVENAAGEVLEVNAAACRLHGLTREELIGCHVLDLVPAEQRARVAREFPKWFSGKLSYSEGFSTTAAGPRIPVEIRAGRIEYGGERAVVLYVRDITAQRRAEVAAQAADRWTEESLAMLRTLQDNAPVGFALVDRRFRFIQVNEALAQLSGKPVDEHLGRPIGAVVPRLWDVLRQPLQDATRRGGAGPGTEFSLKPQPGPGGWRHCLASCYPVRTFGGELIGVRLIVVDITERKESEERAKRSEESLRALAVHLQTVREEQSRRIAREIHDELGQALTVLKLDLAWLGRELADVLAVKSGCRQKVKVMAREIDGTLQTMRRICTELRPGVLDEIGLTAAIEWQVGEFQRRTGIRCALQLPEEALALDKDRAVAVFRIVQELLTNIARHAHASRVRLAVRAEADQLRLAVHDNGRGIRDSDTRSRRSLGMLGMQERATAFGGRVTVRGAAGRGTTVQVWIPLGKAQR